MAPRIHSKMLYYSVGVNRWACSDSPGPARSVDKVDPPLSAAVAVHGGSEEHADHWLQPPCRPACRLCPAWSLRGFPQPGKSPSMVVEGVPPAWGITQHGR